MTANHNSIGNLLLPNVAGHPRLVKTLFAATDGTVTLTDVTFDYNWWYWTGGSASGTKKFKLNASGWMPFDDGTANCWTGTSWNMDANGDFDDPDLGDPGAGDLTLDATSPCLDAALATEVYLRYDHDGDLRPQGDDWDVGAYEDE